MNWFLNFLRGLWPGRRAPEQRRFAPETPPPEPSAPGPAATALVEPEPSELATPEPEPSESEPAAPPPSAPSPTLVDGMPPLPPDLEPPLLLEESARIGPAPVVAPPVDDAEAETAVAIVTPQADRAEDETKAEPDGGEDDEEEPEDHEEEAYDEEDLLEPDPFISTDAPVIEALSPDDIARLRAEARVLALSGEHRILLSDIAGPGTLAEALNRLLQEGKVTAEFHDPEGEAPHLLYTPLPDPPADGGSTPS